MDIGSIEDLLRPASLVERKQKLGLLAADGSPTRNLASISPPDSSKMHGLWHDHLAGLLAEMLYV